MSAYEEIKSSMQAMKPISCIYQDRYREVCAHTIGTKNGQSKVLAFQYAGESSKGLPPDGEWRCMFVDQIQDVHILDGEWRTRDDHSRPQTCVDEVDFEVIA